ncbi:UDP-glucose/GDP-mannose dehydrogenase family protein [soil metagenome]
MTLTFIGHGYVGLVSAAVFADLGNTVHVIGHTPEKIENLKKGIIPIYEPGLEELVKRNVDAGRLLFTMDYDPAIASSEVIFIAVGTPPKPTGEADLVVVYDVAKKIGQNLDGYSVVITKSTVPIGTNREVQKIINEVKSDKATFDIASVPEFLREGQAIGDTLHPDRVVIGTESNQASDILVQLHEPLGGERVLTTIETAEMIKYAANAFLATKISFANAIAELSEQLGAQGPQVLEAVGLDKRIGKAFLNAGVGYGGSCFPKDVKALIAIAQDNEKEFSLLKEVEAINKHAMLRTVTRAKEMLGGLQGKTVAVLGLAFKPDTDDMRDAPSLVIIPKLLEEGALVKTFDPISQENAKRLLKGYEGITYGEDAYDTLKDADLLLLVTEWNEFKELDLGKVASLMKQKNILDGRNVYDPAIVRKFGFTYNGVGR